MAPRRGDVHWVEFPTRDPRGAEIEKARPCVVAPLTGVNAVRRTAIVVPLTHGAREAPPIFIAIPSQGEDSKAVCDQIVSVDKRGWAGERARYRPRRCSGSKTLSGKRSAFGRRVILLRSFS